jgi:hypothetical protein
MSSVLKQRPQFSGKLNQPSYYEAVGSIIRNMRGKSTLRSMSYQLHAEGHKTPTGLDWTRERLAGYLKTAAL